MFETIPNFRDVGGKALSDGSRLKQGVLLRSASLHIANDADLAALARYNIAVLLDLRLASERKTDANRLPPDFTASVVENANPATGEAPHLTFLRTSDATREEMMKLAHQQYRVIATDPHLHDAVRAALAAWQDHDGALLVHCSAGKDRTGIVIALLLEALGAHPDDILADYMASSAYVTDERIELLTEGLKRAIGKRLTPDVVRGIFGMEASWLPIARTAAIEHYGSIAGYAQHVGLTPALAERLRA